jgi:3',5'-cyclic AMP phosphodiesterase CpdA
LPTLGEVRWGTSDAYGQVQSDSPPSQRHSFRLRGLKPGTAYHYRALARTMGAEVASRDQESLPVAPGITADAGDAAFHTPPGPGKPLRFVVYGDVRSGHDVHALLQRSIADEDPDFALVTGDLVDRGTDEGDWERFFEIAAPLLRQVTLFAAPGNHDYGRTGRGAAVFVKLFRPTRSGEEESSYYSFDVGHAHFVAVDSNQYSSPQQRQWLDRDLADARKRGMKVLFAFAHEGPWSTGMHGDHEVAIREWAPILEKHRVTLFFYGHDHHFERGRVGKLEYVVSGGGGAGLRPQKCGIPGKKACPERVHALFNEHHYIVVELMPQFLRLCPKRPDGMPLEPCSTLPLRK